MPLLSQSRPESGDASSSGNSGASVASFKKKEGSLMSSLKKFLLPQRQHRVASSTSQLAPSRDKIWGSSQASTEALAEAKGSGQPDGHEFSLRTPPRSSASMPLLIPPFAPVEANQQNALPSPRALAAGRRVPVAPSSSALIRLPSIDACTPTSSSGAVTDRSENLQVYRAGNVRASSCVEPRDKAFREQFSLNEIADSDAAEAAEEPPAHCPTQPLPRLPGSVHRPVNPAPAWPPVPDAAAVVEAAAATVSAATAAVNPAAHLPGPPLRDVAAPLSSPAPPLPSLPSSGNGSGSSSTLLAVCPGTPEAMRRPVWRLMDYTITARVYKGEVSSVYKAVCLHSNLKVALKVYSLSRVAENAVHTLVREVRIHTELAHQSVLMLYGVFEEDNRLVLVLERASRGDLFHLHRSLPNCRMSEDQLRVLVLAPLLEALVYLHGRGVCHRDIKPENLLMTGNFQLRLADFGAAINLAQERAVTRTGTVDYMAPEVERCPLKAAPEDNKDNLDLAYTTAADVWSVGVLSYELLVGFPPFITTDGNNGPHAYGNQPRQLSFPHFMSAGAQDFVAGALAERPGDRPTAVQLLRHPWLKHALRQYHMRLQQQQVPAQAFTREAPRLPSPLGNPQQSLSLAPSPLQFQQPLQPQPPQPQTAPKRPLLQQHSSQQLVLPRQLSQQLQSSPSQQQHPYARQASQLRPPSGVLQLQRQQFDGEPLARLARQVLPAAGSRSSLARGSVGLGGHPMSPIAAAVPQ